KDLKYDDIFHLYMYLETDKGTHTRLEKNEVVKATSSAKTEGSCISIPLQNKKIRLDDFINKGEKLQGESKFWAYSALDNNCQIFLRTLLTANGLYNDNANKFIFQDSKEIFKRLPQWSSKVSDALTGLAARIDVLRNGRGAGCKCQEGEACNCDK